MPATEHLALSHTLHKEVGKEVKARNKQDRKMNEWMKRKDGGGEMKNEENVFHVLSASISTCIAMPISITIIQLNSMNAPQCNIITTGYIFKVP